MRKKSSTVRKIRENRDIEIFFLLCQPWTETGNYATMQIISYLGLKLFFYFWPFLKSCNKSSSLNFSHRRMHWLHHCIQLFSIKLLEFAFDVDHLSPLTPLVDRWSFSNSFSSQVWLLWSIIVCWSNLQKEGQSKVSILEFPALITNLALGLQHIFHLHHQLKA